jgi:hypothetical protein
VQLRSRPAGHHGRRSRCLSPRRRPCLGRPAASSHGCGHPDRRQAHAASDRQTWPSTAQQECAVAGPAAGVLRPGRPATGSRGRCRREQAHCHRTTSIGGLAGPRPAPIHTSFVALGTAGPGRRDRRRPGPGRSRRDYRDVLVLAIVGALRHIAGLPAGRRRLSACPKPGRAPDDTNGAIPGGRTRGRGRAGSVAVRSVSPARRAAPRDGAAVDIRPLARRRSNSCTAAADERDRWDPELAGSRPAVGMR